MIKFAVCDDEPDAAKAISDILYKYYPDECEIRTYNNGSSLLEDIMQESFDAFFLDVGMPLIDGFEIAKRIRAVYPQVKIIFVSERADLAHMGYIYKAFRFVRKNKLDQELGETAKSLSMSLSSPADLISFRSWDGEIRISIKKIRFFKADGHFLILYGPNEERICGTMQELEESLKEKGFIRIHKSYLVNYRYLYSIGNRSVKLLSGEELPMSRNRICEVRKGVHEYRQLNNNK
ncbi:MAG: LytTR family DNA-binding domain-containing protein [Oscillospiraceae bacterium]|nr:LytTR family DNA-binding domain-containing protein [Oscillospiraceae bacterium]